MTRVSLQCPEQLFVELHRARAVDPADLDAMCAVALPAVIFCNSLAGTTVLWHLPPSPLLKLRSKPLTVHLFSPQKTLPPILLAVRALLLTLPPRLPATPLCSPADPLSHPPSSCSSHDPAPLQRAPQQRKPAGRRRLRATTLAAGAAWLLSLPLHARGRIP